MTLTEKIEIVGMYMDPSKDIKTAEAKEIIRNSSSTMEAVGNGYIYGYMKGSETENAQEVPILNIRMMTDEEWNRLAYQNYLERRAVMA